MKKFLLAIAAISVCTIGNLLSEKLTGHHIEWATLEYWSYFVQFISGSVVYCIIRYADFFNLRGN